MKIMTEKQAKEYYKLTVKIFEILKGLEPSEAFFVLETTKQAYLMTHVTKGMLDLLEKFALEKFAE